MNLAAITLANHTAIVHFLGIMAFTPLSPPVNSRGTIDQPPPQGGFVVVVPNIPSHSILTQTQTPTALAVAPPAPRNVPASRANAIDSPAIPDGTALNSDVEAHEAFLILQEQ